MTPLILLILLLGLLGGFVWLRRQQWSAASEQSDPPRPARQTPWYTSRGRPGVAVLALIGLLSVGLLLSNLGLLSRGPAVPSGEFVVRVAPFVSNGEDQRQGAFVAAQLINELKRTMKTTPNIGVLPTPITSADQALEAARAGNVDVLIWGQVEAGATADQPGLRPYLLWNPHQPFVPQTWQGYDGHFALPADYDLALQPLNGPAVLAPLLDGINHFSRGDADRAADAFAALRRDYGDVLRPELPAMLQAIILWAQGRYPDAEAEAQTAVEAAPRPEHWNNLGAIQLDQQKLDPSRTALLQALSAAPNLPQAHANLGRLLLDQGQPAAALPDLRSAANLVPNSTPILATLGEAYRRSGQLEEARTTVSAVLALDADNGPALAEQSMLALTPALTATGQLEWELERPPMRSAEDLAEIRSRAEQGINAIEELRNEFLRRANAYGVDGRPAMQRLAETQAAILEQELLNRRYQLMLVQIEQGRVLATRPRSTLRRFWDSLTGRRTPLQEAIATSAAALKQEPNLPLQYEYHYQQGRAAYLSRNPRLAGTQWDATIQLADTAPPTTTLKSRPEGHYGRAQLLLADNQRDQARDELNAALAADERFFPARQQLASLAEQDQRWADAEQHYRWLAEHRPWIKQSQLDLARVLQAQGNAPAAEAQLLPLANDGNPDALVMLAAMYRSAGKLDETTNVLQRALTAAPNSAAVHEELAALAQARNDPVAAETELRQALELEPNRASARIALGRLYAGQLGQPAAAAEQFRAALEQNTTDPHVYRQLGEVLLQTGNPKAATESFRKALDLAPNSHEAHHGLATAYLAQGRYDDAAEEEQQALTLANGNYTLALVGLADVAREQHRYDDAVKQYSAALERDPKVAGAYLGLGKTAMAQGHADIALTHYRAGLAVEPQNVPLLIELGNALLQQNDIAGARQAYDQAKQLAPGDAAVYAGLGRTLWKAGQTDEALTVFDQAIKINPNDSATLQIIGDINESLDRPTAALEAYERAAEARKDWHEPRFRRGVLLLKLEQTDAAIKDLEASVKLKDDFSQGHYWLGRAYRAAGRFSDAARQFRRAIELQGDYFEARYFLGRTLDELGQAPDAVNTYTAILNEAPQNDPWRGEAARELDRIR